MLAECRRFCTQPTAIYALRGSTPVKQPIKQPIKQPSNNPSNNPTQMPYPVGHDVAPGSGMPRRAVYREPPNLRV